MFAVSDAIAVGWACFGLGAVVFVIGCVLGVYIDWKEIDGDASSNVKGKVVKATKEVSDLTTKAVEAANTDGKNTDTASAAEATGTAVVSTMKDVEGLLKTLPERLRFAGFLILIGALLMSVAAVQFGGHSVF